MIRRPPRSTLFPYTDALPISKLLSCLRPLRSKRAPFTRASEADRNSAPGYSWPPHLYQEKSDRKSTRLNSSHLVISYAVFCLKKKKVHINLAMDVTWHRIIRL